MPRISRWNAPAVTGKSVEFEPPPTIRSSDPPCAMAVAKSNPLPPMNCAASMDSPPAATRMAKASVLLRPEPGQPKKSSEADCPTTMARPAESTTTALASSAPAPPRYVPYDQRGAGGIDLQQVSLLIDEVAQTLIRRFDCIRRRQEVWGVDEPDEVGIALHVYGDAAAMAGDEQRAVDEGRAVRREALNTQCLAVILEGEGSGRCGVVVACQAVAGRNDAAGLIHRNSLDRVCGKSGLRRRR